MGKYIVVKKIERQDKPDVLVTSSKPRVHIGDEMTAMKEAIRLAEKEQVPFCIFQEIGVILPTEKKQV